MNKIKVLKAILYSIVSDEERERTETPYLQAGEADEMKYQIVLQQLRTVALRKRKTTFLRGDLLRKCVCEDVGFAAIALIDRRKAYSETTE
jgi:hypothetical protein